MVLLYGYYGQRNAGDDAFTTICVKELTRAGHGTVGVLASELPHVSGLRAKPLFLRREWWGLTERIERRRIDNWLQRGAGIVVGGGSLFRSSASLAELEQLLDRSPNGMHRAIGVSIGPFQDAAARDGCARVLRRFATVAVRDQESFDRVRAIAPDATVELTFDLAPLLGRYVRNEINEESTGIKELGVALCGPALDGAGEAALTAALASWLASGSHHRVVLLPFNEHPRKGDLATHRRLEQQLSPHGQVVLHRYTGDPTATWARIAKLDAVVAMRLHAAVFAYCTERPTLVVPYEEKCTAWAKMVRQQEAFVSDASAVTHAHLQALVGHATPTAQMPVAEAVERANANFAWTRE